MTRLNPEKNKKSKELSRRKFLGTVSAATAGFTIIPRHVMPGKGYQQPSDTVNVAGIGIGARGAANLRGLCDPDVPIVNPQRTGTGQPLTKEEIAAREARMANRPQGGAPQGGAPQGGAPQGGQQNREPVKLANIYALCDVDTDFAAHIFKGYPKAKVYTDWRQLLEKEKSIDAVMIGTPDHSHAPIAAAFMRQKKHIYVEKPMCKTIFECRKLAEIAKEYNVVTQMGNQGHASEGARLINEWIQSGAIGLVREVHLSTNRPIWPQGNITRPAGIPIPKSLDWDVWLGPCPWRPYNASYVNGGGWYHYYDFATDVAMWGAHTVAQALAGLDMTNVSAIEFEYDRPDATMVTRLSNGMKLVLFRVAGSVWEPCNYWHGACGERFEGPDGWVAAADGYSKPDVSSPALLLEYKNVLADYTARTQRSLNHVRDFFDCIRSRRLTVANPDVMYRSMSICLAADICEQLKRNLKFDLSKAEFVGDQKANRMRSRAMRAPYMG